MQIVNVNSMNFILVYISFKVMVMSLLHLDLHGVFRSWSPISYALVNHMGNIFWATVQSSQFY